MSNSLGTAITSAFNKGIFSLRKNSPTILAGAGILGIVAGMVSACVASTKVESLIDDTKSQIDSVHEALEKMSDNYTEEDSKHDLTIIYSKAAWSFVKLYAVPVAITVASVGCLLASNNILHRRNVALAAAYATVESGFKKYRDNVRSRFGEDVDRELRFGSRKEKITETVIDENGEEKKVKKTVDVVSDTPSMYARFFDEVNSTCWVKDPFINKQFLQGMEKWANDKLRLNGYLFLSDVYKTLGMEEDEASRVVGWVYDPDNPICISFGLYNVYRDGTRNFINGNEPAILLDFNVMGNIVPIFENYKTSNRISKKH